MNWNARMVTRDGEEIEPSDYLAGSWDHETGQTQSVPAPTDARQLRRERLEATTPDIDDDDPVEGHSCPDCDRDYETREAQADCMRRHARGMADLLEQEATASPVRERAAMDPRLNALLLVVIAIAAALIATGVTHL